MKKRKALISSLLILLAILTLQTTSQRSHPVYAYNTYPNLGLETHINVPNCIPGPNTAIVYNNAQLDLAINNPAMDVICMNPGHYTGVNLDISGTAENPRYLLPNHTGHTLPEPWNLPQNQRVIVDKILFNSAYWYTVGLNVVGDLGRIIDFMPGAHGNVIDSLLVEGQSERLPDGIGNRTIAHISQTAYYNTIQNSVIRNPPRIPHKDSHCLVIQDSRYNTIINNQIYDCPGDGIQINTAETVGSDNRGTRIFNNEIYLTERLYASCTDSSIDANLNGPGECACAENGLDIKHNVATPVGNNQDRMEITGNTLYGFRQTHQACGGTGDNTAAAIYLHKKGSRDIWIQSNLIADSNSGILLKDSDGGPDHITVMNNMLYNISKKRALHIAGGENNQFTHNTIVLTLDDGKIIGRNSIAIIGNALNGIISNNLVISSNEWYRAYYDPDTGAASNFIIKNNGYVALATPFGGLPGDNDMIFPDEPLTNFEAYCFEIEKLTTDNHQCFPYLIPKPNAATVETIHTTAHGAPFDFFFNARYLPFDLGATENQSVNFQFMIPIVISE